MTRFAALQRLTPGLLLCLAVLGRPLVAADREAAVVADGPQQTALWTSGEEGYHSYRIPSLIATSKGTLLAFCEGRRQSRSDTGAINLLMKRSTDGGKTWSGQQVVWADGANTCGNPCPVLDRETGTVWLLLTHNLGKDNEGAIKTKTAAGTRTVWVCRSEDDGQTWSEPVEITSTTKAPGWGWYATGPGVGIQIAHGPHKGRLVIPCDHSYDLPQKGTGKAGWEFGSHAIYSDDHGQTWTLGGTIRPKMNECQVVELAGGRGELLMNLRSYAGRQSRAHSRSTDGGESWTAPVQVPELIEPVCQASLIRYSWPADGQPGLLLFSNPASRTSRVNLTVRYSRDEGETWSGGRTLHAGPAAYSCLAALRNGMVGCLYECGKKHAYETITFARFEVGWVTDEEERERESN